MGEEHSEPVEVPWTRLSPKALRGLMEEFVTRDGTDYGSRERSLESKVAELRGRLERGEAKVVFYPGTGSANIVPAT